MSLNGGASGSNLLPAYQGRMVGTKIFVVACQEKDGWEEDDRETQ